MRDLWIATLIGLCVLALGIFLVASIASAHEPDHQLRNPYWPFTVEMSVRDE